MKKVFIFMAVTFILLSQSAVSQETDFASLPSRPYKAGVDPDIDKFISSWQESMPKSNYGQLVERDVLKKSAGDPMNPHTKGAVLTYLNRFTHGTLNVNASTTPSKLSGEQVVFFVDGGRGTIKAGGTTAELYSGIGVLMPPDIEFVITNTGKVPLTMYVFAEPVPDGFAPKKTIVVKDTNSMPIGGTTGHWSHIFTPLFSPADGTAWLDMGPVWYDAMTMGQPHSHNPGFEEVWTALDGDINILLGKQMRKLPVGSAYKVPPDYMSPHSNINAGDKPIRLMWFIVRTVPEPPPPPQSMLAPKPFDPDVDPNIDMYIGNWRDSQPRHTHGSLVEREVLSKCEGDPMNPPRKGAVLKYVNRFVHATLMGYNSTLPTTPIGEQELFYILSGKGTLASGGKTYDLYSGMTFLVPGGVEFSMINTGEEPMTMYLVAEPTPDGFSPKRSVSISSANFLALRLYDLRRSLSVKCSANCDFLTSAQKAVSGSIIAI